MVYDFGFSLINMFELDGKFQEIPKELQVYLLQACDEYEVTKNKSYKIWLNELKETLTKLSEKEKREFLNDPNVPSHGVNIPKDDAEENQSQIDDEW